MIDVKAKLLQYFKAVGFFTDFFLDQQYFYTQTVNLITYLIVILYNIFVH